MPLPKFDPWAPCPKCGSDVNQWQPKWYPTPVDAKYAYDCRIVVRVDSHGVEYKLDADREHLHVNCKWCGWKTIAACRDAVEEACADKSPEGLAV